MCNMSLMLQILPINIKGLAGSVATLSNWFFSFVVTMTANLLLTWSSGGLSVCLSLSLSLTHTHTICPMQSHGGITVCLHKEHVGVRKYPLFVPN